MKKTIVLVVILALMCIGLVGCINVDYQEKYEEEQDENAHMYDENAQLKEENDKLRQRITYLEEMLDNWEDGYYSMEWYEPYEKYY